MNKKNIVYMSTYLGQPIYEEDVTYVEDELYVEITSIKKKKIVEKEKILFKKDTKEILEFYMARNNEHINSLKKVKENNFLYQGKTESKVVINTQFFIPILLQKKECIDLNSNSILVKPVLVFGDERLPVTLIPYTYFGFKDKINIVLPGNVCLTYAEDGHILTVKEFETQITKKRVY